MMNNMIHPFEEARFFSSLLPNVLTPDAHPGHERLGVPDVFQEHRALAVESFLPQSTCGGASTSPNYGPEHGGRVAEEVLRGGEDLLAGHLLHRVPRNDGCAYYLRVLKEIVSLCGGTKDIILVIKDMAGWEARPGSRRLVDASLAEVPGD